MDDMLYRRQAELITRTQPDGWAGVRVTGVLAAVELDPILAAVWSQAEARTAGEVAEAAGVSVYLAQCALALFQHAGMLVKPDLVFGLPSGFPATPDAFPSVAAAILYSSDRSSLSACSSSLFGQRYPGLAQATVFSRRPVVAGREPISVVEYGPDGLVSEFRNWLAGREEEAILVLGSHVSLAPGSLAEMARILRLRNDIAGVAPRLMWNRLPRFVAQMGDWRDVAGMEPDPHAGHIDVGQFQRRCLEVPAVDFGACLLSRQVLCEVGLPEGFAHLDRQGAEWCRRTRQEGHHFLVAAQAIAYQPWLWQFNWPQGEPGTVPDEMIPEGPGPMVRERVPALTVDALRGYYSQYRAIAPRQTRPQIAFIVPETNRYRAIARELDATCEVNWLEPGVEDEENGYQFYEEADLVLTTAGLLRESELLQQCRRPLAVDMQPPAAFVEEPQDWLEMADLLICASEEGQRYWQEQQSALPDGHSRISVDPGMPYARTMVLAPGIVPVEPASRPVLRGVHRAVGPEDVVILWCGGLGSGDDPLTAVRAFERLQSPVANLKLVLATFEYEGYDKVRLGQAMDTATGLGLDGSVILIEGIPAHQRNSYLAEADVGMLLNSDTIQAGLHGPAEVAACIGAGLPLVITAGRAGSSLIQQYGLGQTAPAGDVDVVAEALALALQSKDYEARFAAARQALAWPETVLPLARFCQRPEYALRRELNLFLLPNPAPSTLGSLPVKAWSMLRQQGPKATLSEVSHYIRWKMGI